MNKRGVELSLSTLVIIILVIVTLLVATYMMVTLSSDVGGDVSNVTDGMSQQAKDCIENPRDCLGGGSSEQESIDSGS
ncbi:MAG: hypothetical protein ACMXYF_03715 [Candidatus Woesearchaeota archaeon]